MNPITQEEIDNLPPPPQKWIDDMKKENKIISSKSIMTTKEILRSHPVTILRKEISKTNIKGYSKMKKNEVIELMLKAENKEKFKHIKMAESKKTALKGTHKMPDGKLMTGAVHSKSSKPVKEEPKKETPKKEEPKKRTKASIEKDSDDFHREHDELRDKTLNIILKEDKDLLKRPTEFKDPKKMKKMKKLSNQLFETYKKSMSDLYDKYKFSKNRYKEKALSNFKFFIRLAKKKEAPKKAEPVKAEPVKAEPVKAKPDKAKPNKKRQEIKSKLEELLSQFTDESMGYDKYYELNGADDFMKTLSSIKSKAKDIIEFKKLVRESKYKETVIGGNGEKGKKWVDWYWLMYNTNEIYSKLNELINKY